MLDYRNLALGTPHFGTCTNTGSFLVMSLCGSSWGPLLCLYVAGETQSLADSL